MRKLYSELQGQDVIQRPGRDLGNLPPLPAIFPDTMVSVRHAEAGERQFEMNAAGGGSHAIAPTSAKLRSTVGFPYSVGRVLITGSHRGEFKTCQLLNRRQVRSLSPSALEARPDYADAQPKLKAIQGARQIAQSSAIICM